ncbi:alpha/beta fold hydrolase [Umezawaea tangerina]|nr:alpha/beta fold hydrolase [Umezawaea tangerina]
MALTGCSDAAEATGEDAPSHTSAAPLGEENDFAGKPTRIRVGDRLVTVSCSGRFGENKPVILLMAGLGDGLDKLSGIQTSLSKEHRTCSYDRLGEGSSDQPTGQQDLEDVEKTLSEVLDHVARHHPVVLAGHSLGGLIAARYAPDHQDRVKGMVLLDATPPTMLTDTTSLIPETATGPAAELRAGLLATTHGENPEKLALDDGPVRSAGTIPVEIVRHGNPYLAEIPEYGPALEQVWATGQQKWLALSPRSTQSIAEGSGHYIYVDRPDIALQAIQNIAEEI